MGRRLQTTPRGEPRGRRLAIGDGHVQPNVQASWAGSPAASAKATSAATAGARRSVGIRATIALISARRTSVTSSTTLRPPRRQRDRRLAAIDRSTARRTRLRSTESIAQPRRRRGMDPERVREFADPQRARRRQHDERPVLRQRHFGRGGDGQRPRGHRDERARGGEHRLRQRCGRVTDGSHMCRLQELLWTDISVGRDV